MAVGIAAAGLLPVACGDDGDGGTQPIILGFVHVTIEGLQQPFDSAGVAHVVGVGLDTILRLPAVTDTVLRAPVGTYDISYTPPTGYAVAPGTPSSFNDVTVTASDTLELSVEVVLATAAVEVTVEGLEAGADNGGIAAVLRTDIVGQTPVFLPIPAGSGNATLTVLPGDYTITYTQPTGYILADGETGVRNGSVDADQTLDVSFDVELDETPAPSAVFHSDFSTALGKSVEALTDADQPHPWEELLNNGNAMTVIPSTGLDFPTANVLQIDAVWRLGDPGANAANPRITGLPIPDQGESLFYRWFIRVMIPDEYTIDPLTHPIQDARNGGTTNWMFEVRTGNEDGAWELTFNVQANEFPNHRWGPAGATGVNNDPLLLNKDETYRIEMQILRTGTNTFNMHVGVYEGNDTTPLYDDADFRNVNGTASLASTPQLLFKDIAELHQFQIGHNGFTGGVESDYGFIISYQGGFAICTETWCGPYAGGI